MRPKAQVVSRAGGPQVAHTPTGSVPDRKGGRVMVAPPFPVWAWLVFVGLVLALLFLDLFVFHRNAREVPFGEAMWLSAFWIAVSLAFGGFVWFLRHHEGCAEAGGAPGSSSVIRSSRGG